MHFSRSWLTAVGWSHKTWNIRMHTASFVMSPLLQHQSILLCVLVRNGDGIVESAVGPLRNRE